MRRTTRTFVSFFAVAALGASLVPALADDFGSALSNGQGVNQGGGAGPAVPGLAWVTELDGLEYHGRHSVGGLLGYSRSAMMDGMGNVLIQADDSLGDDSGGQSTDKLVSVDTSDGSVNWTADAIRPECPITVVDGTIWGFRRTSTSGDVELVSIDPATGAVTVELTDTVNDPGDPALALCNSQPLRTTNDGSLLIARQYTPSKFLRVFDISVDPVVTTSILTLDQTATSSSWGQDYYHEIRVAPPGSPADGDVYLFERTQGATNDCCGDDDVNWIHAFDPTSLPAMGSFPDVIDRSVELGLESLADGSIILIDDAIILSGEEGLSGREASDRGDGVDARMLRVTDDGTAFGTVLQQAAYRDNDDRMAGEHRWHYKIMARSSDNQLFGLYRGTEGTPSGIDPVTLDQTFEIPEFNCLSGTLVADGAGNAYFFDFCDDVIVSIGPDGHVRWTFSTESVHPFIDGSGEYDLDQLDFDSFGLRTVTDDGELILTGELPSDSQAVVVLAIDLATTTERRAGASRLETAVEISQTVFPAGAGVVVVAKASDYPDALSGGPLAVYEGGPLLLSATAGLSSVTRDEIVRLGASRAVLLGGTAALSEVVEDELDAMGLAVTRLAGDDRFDTAALVAERIGATKAVVVEGRNASPSRGWPDAVASSSWAAVTGRAILLVTKTSLPAATQAALGPISEVAVVGGEGAVSADVFNQVRALVPSTERIAGSSRYATSAMVAQRAVDDGVSLDVTWLATGAGFVDALAAGPAAALTNGVLLLISGQNPSGGVEALDFLSANKASVGTVYMIGGTGAISSEVEAEVNRRLGR